MAGKAGFCTCSHPLAHGLDVLIKKMQLVMASSTAKTIMLVGGVAANKYIRSAFEELALDNNKRLLMPRLELCTDNGIMIAKAGLLRAKFAQKTLAKGEIFVKPRWQLSDYLDSWWVGAS